MRDDPIAVFAAAAHNELGWVRRGRPLTTMPVSSSHRRIKPLLQVFTVCCAATSLLAVGRQSAGPPTYFPPLGEWRIQAPATYGVDKAKLDDAIAFAIAHENPESKDLAVTIPNQFRSEAPYNTLIGPTQPSGGANGLIIRRGSIIAEWGDTARSDMTFSVTKTFLSTVVGVAFDMGQIRSVTDRVAGYLPKDVDLFNGPHNAAITWEHLRWQTSDWSGTLWGKPDRADRPPRNQTVSQWQQRELHEPGTVYSTTKPESTCWRSPPSTCSSVLCQKCWIRRS